MLKNFRLPCWMTLLHPFDLNDSVERIHTLRINSNSASFDFGNFDVNMTI